MTAVTEVNVNMERGLFRLHRKQFVKNAILVNPGKPQANLQAQLFTKFLTD